MRWLRLVVMSSFAPTAAALATTQAPTFEVTRVTGPGSCSAPLPMAVNGRGQIALICSTGSQTRSFVWDDGELVALGTFGSGFVRHEASDLNDGGAVAGSSWGNGFPAAAWSWEAGAYTPLGSLGGVNAASFAINELGQQTGWAHTAPPLGTLLGFAYLFDGTAMINLGELPEAIGSEGFGINDLGQVAGISGAFGEPFFRGVIADTTIGMHGVGTLGGLESDAQALNDAGQVVGRAHTGRIVQDRWAYHAYRWQDGVLTELAPLAGGEFSGATAINARGDVVGWSRAQFLGDESWAVLWRDGVAIDLNARISPGSGWVLRTTLDLNDAGEIVGLGLFEGQSAAFLLTPLAEEIPRAKRAGAPSPPKREPLAASAGVPPRAYRLTDLGALPGGSEAWAFDLNDLGQVACTALYDQARRFYHAALWEEGVSKDLGHLGIGAFHSFATAINAFGHVVGGSPQELGFSRKDRAFLHDGSELVDLGALQHDASSFAFDVDERGHVVGHSGTGQLFDGKEVMHAVLWSGGEILDLGTLGGLYSRALAVNNALQIVGASLTGGGGPMHAFLWSGSMTDLGTLGGRSSEAWDVDDHGRIVGVAENADGVRRAFLWKDGGMRDLGALPGARASEAFGVDDAGEIVGSSWVAGAGPHAVLWADGLVLDLNDLVAPDPSWTLQSARAINARGQIAGYGRHAGSTRAFLLTPLPR